MNYTPTILTNINNDYFNIAEFYFDEFEDIYVNPIIFLEFTLILIAVFIIRGLFLYNIEKEKGFKNDKEKHNMKRYIAGHMLIQLVFAHAIAYILIKLTNAQIDSYIINMAFAPTVGLISAIIFDVKVLIPLEGNSSVGSVNKADKSKKSKKGDSSGGNNITVNINNIDNDENTHEHNNHHDVPAENSNLKYLDSDKIIDEDNFDEIIVKSINDVITSQFVLNNRFDELTSQVTEMARIVEMLRLSEMNDKKIELKILIYKCLNNGFATPQENDKITLKYQSYRDLGGNHEIQTLYEEHYLKLSIHEDRRKNNTNVENDRRTTNNNCEYGKFDNE